jgi:hypothetical protein
MDNYDMKIGMESYFLKKIDRPHKCLKLRKICRIHCKSIHVLSLYNNNYNGESNNPLISFIVWYIQGFVIIRPKHAYIHLDFGIKDEDKITSTL